MYSDFWLIRTKCADVVKYEPSLYFGSSAICVLARMCCLWYKLFPRSSPNPNEYTHERSRSKCTLIHELQRFWNKAGGLYLRQCLLHWPSFQHLIASAPAAQVVSFYCSIYDLSSWHRCPNLNFNHKVVEKKNDIMQRNTSLALYLASMSSAIQYPKSLHGSQVCLPLHYQGFAIDASKCCI